MTKKKVLITGATGSTGQSAVKKLLDLDVPVRALVHKKDARSEQLSTEGVEILQGDLSDFGALSAALKGITEAYYLYPIQVPGIVESTAFFAQAAIDNDVKAIVNMSQMQASRDVKSHASQNHWIAEQILDRSGIPTTHLRPTLFAEWLLYLRGAIKDENILPLPFGDVRYAPITGEDQGRVIAAILNHPGEHAGKIYPLFGAKELSQVEIAGLLSKVLGRTITYVPMEIDAFDAVLEKMGFTPYFRQHMTHVAQNTRDGVFSGMNDLVEKLSGQKPMEMIDYIIKNKALFI